MTNPSLTSPEARSLPPTASRSLRTALVLAAGLLLVVHVVLLLRFAVDWPQLDDFTQILAIPGYVIQLPTCHERLLLLTALELEHRAATVRALGWIASLLPGGMNFVVLIVIGNAMLVAAALFAVSWFPRERRPAAAALAALLLLSPTHYAAQYHATGALQHFGISFFVLGALHVLSRGRHPVATAALAAGATFTSASGVLVFPAAVLLLALLQRRGEAVAWAIGGAIVWALYFVGHKSPHMGALLGVLVADPLRVAHLVLATLGCIGASVPVATGIGALAVLAWASIVASGAWRRVPPVVLAAALSLALTCAMVAAGRATLGIESVMLSRYRSYSGLFVLLTFAALSWALPGRAWAAAGAAGIGCAGALFVQAWVVHLPAMAELSAAQLALRDHYAADGHGHYFIYPREFGDFTLARARDIGSFRGVASPPSVPVSAPASRPTARGAGPFHADVFEGRRAASVYGWIAGRYDALELWMDRDGDAYRAPLVAIGFPAGPLGGIHTAFHGTVVVTGLPPGRYRVGVGTDGSLVWTDKEVVVEGP